MEEREGMTVEEAARDIGIHQRTLRDAINRGEFPAAKIGRRVIVSRTVVRDFLMGKVQNDVLPTNPSQTTSR